MNGRSAFAWVPWMKTGARQHTQLRDGAHHLPSTAQALEQERDQEQQSARAEDIEHDPLQAREREQGRNSSGACHGTQEGAREQAEAADAAADKAPVTWGLSERDREFRQTVRDHAQEQVWYAAALPATHSLRWPAEEDVPPHSEGLVRIWSGSEEGRVLPSHPPATVQADRFLDWLFEHDFLRGREILGSDLQDLYLEWAYRKGWYPLEWAQVAKHLAPRMGGRRLYKMYAGHKRRIYRVPAG